MFNLKNKALSTAALFVVFQSILAQFASLLYFAQAQLWPTTIESWVFFLLYWSSHFIFLGFLFYLFTLFFVFFFLQWLWARWLYALMTSFLIVLLIIDSFVYSQYRFHLNAVVLDLFVNGQGQIISFSLETWLIVFALLGLFLVMNIWIFNRLYNQNPVLVQPFDKYFKNYLLLVIFSFVFSHLLHAYYDARYNSSVVQVAQIFPLSYPVKAKTLLSHFGLVDLEEFKRRKTLKKEFIVSHLNYPLAPLRFQDRPQDHYNILWIVVDSLRHDMLTEEIMPHSYKFSKNATRFFDHFSNSNTTRHGIFGLFYGLPGFYFETALQSQTPPLLMKLLKQKNYQFYIYANAPLTKPEFDQTVFAEIKDLRKRSNSKTVYDRDIEITQLMINTLQNHKKEEIFFAFLFYDSPHEYSYPPDYKKPFDGGSDKFNYLSLNNKTDPRPVLQIYKNSVHFVDSLIGQVLAYLNEKNLISKTIVVITSDHGQELNDLRLGYWGHNSNYSHYQTQVPLVVYWPGRNLGAIHYRTSHFDVPMTFLKDFFNVENPYSDLGSGFSLFSSVPPRDWILMGREGDYAVYQKNQILVAKPTGDYEVLNTEDYRPLQRSQVDMSHINSALKEMSRFFAN